jgi:3-hydroxyisobutyrate dehydrogenase
MPPPAEPGRTRVGWIGTGVMGASMCGHLVDAGYAATVFTRTASKAEPLLARGAEWATSPREVAERADVVFTMVGYPRDVRDVVLGKDGVLAGASPGDVIVDMTTSEPALAVAIAREAEAQGVGAVDAPVSGGDVGAREARLSIMVGGANEPVRRVEPCLAVMGTTIVHQGDPGSGQHAKAVNQTLVAGTMIGVCEALLYAQRAGLDLDRVLASVSSGAAGSWALSNLAPRIVTGDLGPGFYVEHFVKDMGIVLDECRRTGLALPGLALVHQLYTALVAQGDARLGTHALIRALARLNGTEWAGG